MKLGTIIAFKQNTTAGGGNTYYGFNKNTPEDATRWRGYGDVNRVDKSCARVYAKGSRVDLSLLNFRNKYVDDKVQLTKLMGDKSTLTLNDVLCHERFLRQLVTLLPSELIR